MAEFKLELIDDENELTDINLLIHILKYINSDYIDIKYIRRALKKAKKNKEYDE